MPQVCGEGISLMAKANGKMYSEVWALKTLHPRLDSLQEVYFSLYIAKKQLHLGIIRVTGNTYVRQSKRMLALEPNLTLISPQREDNSSINYLCPGLCSQILGDAHSDGTCQVKKSPRQKTTVSRHLAPQVCHPPSKVCSNCKICF